MRNHLCPVQGDSARFSELCEIAQYRSMGAYMRGNISVAQGLAVESCHSRTRISTMVNPRMFNMRIIGWSPGEFSDGHNVNPLMATMVNPRIAIK